MGKARNQGSATKSVNLTLCRGLIVVLAFSLPLRTSQLVPFAGAAPTTYYVSKLGNNADGSSWATAWNELDQIDWNVVQPGDTILLDGGAEACQPIGLDFNSGQSCGMAYNTTLSVQASGVQNHPITIRLAPEAARNGTVVIDGGVVGAEACPGYPGGYFPDYAVPSTPGNIDPAKPNSAGIRLGSSEWIVVDGTKWGGIELRNHYSLGFDFDHASNSTGRYLKIHHNRGDDFAAGAGMDWNADEVSGNTISHSEIFRNGEDSLHPKGDNFTLEYSYLHDHYCRHPDGIQAYHSQAIHSGAKALSGMVIRYNIFVNHGNLVDNAGWHGQGIFIGNIGDNDSWGENVLIHDNLVIGVAGSGIISLNSRSTGFDIHHNTFVTIGDFGISMNRSAVAPVSIQNNIFYDIGGRHSPRLGFYLPTSDGKTTFADNCVYLAGPVSGNLNERGTIYQDPLFIDIANGDYALHSSSPCLGKGSSITSVGQLRGHGGNPDIELDKRTNSQDADSPPGPYIPAGEWVRWTYHVTNTGNVTLADIVVADDQGVGVSCPQTELDPGEPMRCIGWGIATAGPYVNIGTVTGTTPLGGDTTAYDTSYYFGISPAIEVKQYVNGEHVSAPPGPIMLEGAPISWTYVVSNTGDVALTNVTVSDDQVAAVSCPQTTLTIGDAFTCTATGTATVGQYGNVSTASGTHPGGGTVKANGTSYYLGVVDRPAIDVQKRTNGSGADKPPGPYIRAGNAVSWVYRVTNVGNADVVLITVSDNRLGLVTCPRRDLGQIQWMECTSSGFAELGQYSNTATVTATAITLAGTVPISDTDPSHYYGVYTRYLPLIRRTLSPR